MKIKFPLSTAIVGLLSFGLVGQVSAYTSAGAKLEYDNVGFLVTAPGTALNSYQFKLTTSALLDTVDNPNNEDGDTAICSGNASITTCNDSSPRLDADLIAFNTAHTNTDFQLDGPNEGTEYSYANATVQSAVLAGDATTKTSLIAETELLSTGEGGAGATLLSTSGFTWNFTTADDGSVTFVFMASADLYSATDNPDSIFISAGSSISSSVVLTQNKFADGSDGTEKATWTPDGDGTNGCSGLSGVTCDLELDTYDLNNLTGVSVDPSSDIDPGTGGFIQYRIRFNGLADGDWSIVLNGGVQASVTKVEEMPEPEMLLMLGLGLTGFASSSMLRRRKQVV